MRDYSYHFILLHHGFLQSFHLNGNHTTPFTLDETIEQRLDNIGMLHRENLLYIEDNYRWLERELGVITDLLYHRIKLTHCE